MDSEMMRFVRQEIRREMNVILSGASGTNTSIIKENIEQMYPGMPTLTDRPLMHPYGFASRAPRGTVQVVAKQGEHVGNRLVLGHRAADRPTDLAEGESVLYSPQGDKIYVRNGTLAAMSAKINLISAMIKLGSESSAEPLLLGKVTQGILSDILGLIKTLATDVSALTVSSFGAPPDNAAAFVATAALATSQKATVSSGGLLSEKAFTEK